eukprot:1393376-Amorphochlora_amoeboformis.AAC.1
MELFTNAPHLPSLPPLPKSSSLTPRILLSLSLFLFLSLFLSFSLSFSLFLLLSLLLFLLLSLSFSLSPSHSPSHPFTLPPSLTLRYINPQQTLRIASQFDAILPSLDSLSNPLPFFIILATFVGSLADKYGRKRMCQ